MRKASYAQRLQPALRREAERKAPAAGTTLNQLVSRAVAEKLSAVRTDHYLSGMRRVPMERAGDDPRCPVDEIEVAG